MRLLAPVLGLLVVLGLWFAARPRPVAGAPPPTRGPLAPVREAPAPASAPTARVPVRSLAAGRIEGVASDPEGHLLSVPVALRRVALADRTRLATPREDGTHLFGGLEFGRWEVSADGPGFLPASEALELSPQDPEAWFHLILEPTRRVEVRLEDAHGQALFDALASAGLGPLSLPNVVARTEAGEIALQPDPLWRTWRTELPRHARATIHAECGGREVARTALVAEGGETALSVPVERVLETRARLSLTLVRRDGRPCAAPRAWLEAPRARSLALALDERGRLLGESIPSGALALWVLDEGCERLGRSLDLGAGERVDLGPIALAQGHVLAGRMLDSAGRPCSLPLRALPLEPLAMEAPRTVRSDVEGRVRLEGLRSGRWRLESGATESWTIVIPGNGDEHVLRLSTP